ncbi:MAG TPA: hypothetical protein VMO26_13795 [Vicinamibacterales bacterium]|nr:hypothetical protein [Vicinamibacterales bacterium]
MRFDASRLEVNGTPALVLTSVLTKDSGAVNVAISNNGSLGYVSGTGAIAERSELVLVDRQRRVTPVAQTEATGRYIHPGFAPDGRRVAVSVRQGPGAFEDSGADLWVLDLDRRTRNRLTFAQSNLLPIWSPDGSRIAFARGFAGRLDILSVAADGSSEPQALLVGGGAYPASWSGDGRTIAYAEQNDLWMLSLDGGPTSSLFLRTPFNESAPRFSPDGRWVAYTSDKTGQSEVYVRPFRDPGTEEIVSAGGGREPVWAHNGSELYFRSGSQMLAARIETFRAVSRLA